MAYEEELARAFVVRNGIDVLVEEEFRPLRDARIGLLTNHSGATLDGRSTIDALWTAEDVSLERIFAPEHGMAGSAPDGVPVADMADPGTGLPVLSLFGERDRPTAEMLDGLTAVLIDMQDAGCRFYTYVTTMGYMLEACAEHHIRVYVLDRPNPINGFEVEGPSSDAAAESFVNYHPMPVRHGMTLGELARMFNAERDIGADLRVVTMAGWQRGLWFDQTGQPWRNPSPNLRDLTAAALYPGVGLLETTNVSVGRGTEMPFHVLGAPWIDGEALAKRLARAEQPGVTFEAVTFTPTDERHPHAGKACNGVRFVVSDKEELVPSLLGLELIRALRQEHERAWDFSRLDRLLCRPDLIEAIEDDAEDLDLLWQPDPDFFETRAKYLLY